MGQRRAEVSREVIRQLGGSVEQLVLYSEVARLGSSRDLEARVTFDIVYGSNFEHALRLARGACEASGAVRVVVIASSTPSAHLQPNGTAFFSFPPVAATLQATVEEIREFERADLRVDTLVLGGYGHEPRNRLGLLAALMRDLTEPLEGSVVAAEQDEPTATLVDRFLMGAGLVS